MSKHNPLRMRLTSFADSASLKLLVKGQITNPGLQEEIYNKMLKENLINLIIYFLDKIFVLYARIVELENPQGRTDGDSKTDEQKA